MYLHTNYLVYDYRYPKNSPEWYENNPVDQYAEAPYRYFVN